MLEEAGRRQIGPSKGECIGGRASSEAAGLNWNDCFLWKCLRKLRLVGALPGAAAEAPQAVASEEQDEEPAENPSAEDSAEQEAIQQCAVTEI